MSEDRQKIDIFKGKESCTLLFYDKDLVCNPEWDEFRNGVMSLQESLDSLYKEEV